jgi:hypothetical protein
MVSERGQDRADNGERDHDRAAGDQTEHFHDFARRPAAARYCDRLA